MLERIALASMVAVFASTASMAAAAGKGKPVHVKPYTGPLLRVTPLKGKPKSPLTISGARFAPSKKLHAEIDCPVFATKGQPLNGRWNYTAKTDRKGRFTLKVRFPTLKRAKSGICNVYVLNTPPRGPSWVSTGFTVT